MSIAKGELISKLHNIYNKGSRKERGNLKFLEKFGPIKLRDQDVCILSFQCMNF